LCEIGAREKSENVKDADQKNPSRKWVIFWIAKKGLSSKNNGGFGGAAVIGGGRLLVRYAR
jgi:hypothetical protein